MMSFSSSASSSSRYVEHRRGELAVGRRDDLQRHRDVVALPLLLDALGLLALDHDRQGDEPVGRERPGVGERGHGRPVHPADEHDDGVGVAPAAVARRRARRAALDPVVVALHPGEDARR